MYKLIKTLNRFNGNICFIGNTDSGDYVFECDYQNRVLSYDSSSKPIFDVCMEKEDSYLVTFSDNWLGKYSGGTLTEMYINTGISSVDKIVINTSSEYYLLSRALNTLYKYDSGIIWSLSLPDYSLRYDGKIMLRESDNTVIYYNNSNLYVIRDDTTKAVILNSLAISGSGDLSVNISNEFNPTYAYMRARYVSGKELEQSSSSSSNSSSSSSSSSSYILNWSSSSSSSSSNCCVGGQWDSPSEHLTNLQINGIMGSCIGCNDVYLGALISVGSISIYVTDSLNLRTICGEDATGGFAQHLTFHSYECGVTGSVDWDGVLFNMLSPIHCSV